MISYNNNKIKELYDGKQDVNKTLFVGRPIGQFYLLKSEGIWQTNEAAEAAKYNAQPGDRKILDAKKDYVINGEDRDFCEFPLPNIMVALRIHSHIKVLTLPRSLLLQGT